MIRRNPITGDPVLLAVGRAERPNAFRDAARCPFCPGNEHETPPEIARAGDPWHLRVFPNKYPASEHHEVIVESSRHDATFDTLTPEEAADAVRMYVARYDALARRAGVDAVCLFKNHGAAAGASIPHMHSQAVATSFVPPRIAREIDGFARAASCPLCTLLDAHLIAETADFTWTAPYASSMPYEQWIVPRAHAGEMTSVTPRARTELALLLQRASAAMLGAGDAFNWIFVNFPNAAAAHWYVQLFTRQALWAGFEFGSGSAIEVIDPAAVAEQFAQRRQ